MFVLWVMMLCIRLEGCRKSGRICCFHITGIVFYNGVQNDDKCEVFSGPKPVRHYFVD